MQKKFLFLFMLLCSYMVYGQGNAITISNFTVKNQLPPNAQEWAKAPAALLLVAQNNTWGDRPVRLWISVKKGDSKICGNPEGILLDYFKTRSFTPNDLSGCFNNCEALPPGDYTLCAQFRGMGDNRQWVDISNEVCKPFTVGGGSSDNQKYKGPSIVFPLNNKVFTEKETNAPITLRCTPVVPKPQEPVIYHYRIWQVASGQSPTQAMTSQPVVEKEVENLTQTIITSGLFPCNPNCQFVWAVQATNREGKPYGENNGISEAAVFGTLVDIAIIDPNISRPCIACNQIIINAPLSGQIQNNGTGSLSFTVNLSASPKKVKRIKADLVYFDMKPNDENCLICNKVSNTFGNFNTCTTTNTNFSGGINTSHTAQFDASADIDISNGIPLNFTLKIPPMVSCCNAILNFCIRYIITFEDCTVCNVLVCYP